MAVVNYNVEQVSPLCVTVTWPNLQNGDTGNPFPCAGYKLESGYLSGTLGTSGEMVVEASDSVSSPIWVTTLDQTSLGNIGSTNILGTTRPHITNGNGSTNLTLTVVLLPISIVQ